MSSPKVSPSLREERMEEINQAIELIRKNSSFSTLHKGILLSDGNPKKSPIGIIILSNSKNTKPLKQLLSFLPSTDFKLNFPLELSKILTRLSILSRKVKRLKKQIMIDEMTSLYNYRFFKKQLKTEISRSKRTGFPCSLILFDIDKFKTINDSYGHLAGNEVIKEVAKRITQTLRSIDYPARYGGDEFAIILPSTGLLEAIGIAERIRGAISQKPFTLSHDLSLSVTVTGGVAEFSDLFHTTMTDLIDAADRALYIAKKEGRNRIGYFEEELSKITEIGIKPDERGLLLTSMAEEESQEEKE